MVLNQPRTIDGSICAAIAERSSHIFLLCLHKIGAIIQRRRPFIVLSRKS